MLCSNYHAHYIDVQYFTVEKCNLVTLKHNLTVYDNKTFPAMKLFNELLNRRKVVCTLSYLFDN